MTHQFKVTLDASFDWRFFMILHKHTHFLRREQLSNIKIGYRWSNIQFQWHKSIKHRSFTFQPSTSAMNHEQFQLFMKPLKMRTKPREGNKKSEQMF